MSAAVIQTGIGCERDAELKNGVRLNQRTFLMGSQERRELLLGLSLLVRHRDFIQGDLMSEADGTIVPFSLDLPFAGILDSVGEDPRGRYVGSVIRRGIVSLQVEGVSADTTQGTLVYAVPTPDCRCRFTLDAGGVLIGEVVRREVTLSGTVRTHVGLRLPGDSRPYTPESMIDPFRDRL